MRRLILLFLFLMVVGCAAPGFYQFNDSVNAISFSEDVEAVKVEKLSDFLIVKDDIEKIPDKHVAVEFHDTVSVKDFFYSLSRVYKVNIAVDIQQKESEVKDPESKENKIVKEDVRIQVPKYEGSLKGLFKILQKSNGLFVHMVGDSIVVRDATSFSIHVLYPDDKEIISLLKNTFKARDVHFDKTSSVVVFNADYETYRRIIDYFRNYPLSVVELDVAFLEYELSDEQSIGFDVQKFSMTIQEGINTATKLQIKGDNGFTVSLDSGSVSLSAVLHSLSSYSKFRILQRVAVSGLVGKQVSLDVSEKIPYVSKVTTTSGATGSAVRGYEFAEASNGLTIVLDINADGNLIMLKNDLKYQSIARFIDVGTEEDRVSQPVVNARNVKSYVTMRPGELSKLSSIRYEKLSNENSGLYGLNGMLRRNDNRLYEVVVLGRAVVKRYVFQ